uniref:Uncharacterized protein n=1 Tax=Oryza brachyantha TaxID=4533 RepID=J3LV00_ORYBR
MKQQLQVGLLVAAFAVAMVPTTAWCRELCYNSSKVASASPPPGAPMATAVIVFGDSIVDPGNNNNLKTQIKANHAPYGMNFANGEPTGRYSNGLIPTDFIVQGLNVKQLLPPWLGVELSPEDLKTGVSFASGATGYDPLTPVIVSVITLDQQLEYFDDYRAKLVALVGEKETTRIIDGALFVVCAGTDDIANTYFTTPFRSVEYDIPSYVDLLVSGADQFLDKVAAKGARKIGFVGLPPARGVRAGRGGAGGGAAPPLRGEAQLRGQALQLPHGGGDRREETRSGHADGVHRHLRHPQRSGGERRQVRLQRDGARLLRHRHHRGHRPLRHPLRRHLRRRRPARLLRQLPPHAARLQDHRRQHL